MTLKQLLGMHLQSIPASSAKLQLRAATAPSLCACAVALLWPLGTASAGQLTNGGFELLTERATQNDSTLFIYQTMDSAFDRGFPSQLFGTAFPTINGACIDDPNAADGCSTDTTRLDPTGTRFQLNFGPIAQGGSNAYGGLNFVEPQNYGQPPNGKGYNLTGATQILFSVRSPTGIALQFGAGEKTTNFVSLPPSNSTYTSVCIAVHGEANTVCPQSADMKLNLTKPMTLADVHVLFTAVTNYANAPTGGVILLDQIQYAPFPHSQLTIPTLPLSTQTFGVIPAQQQQQGPVAFPPDQVNRNVAALYESSLTALALFARGEQNDLTNALQIATSLVYAVSHDNAGDPLPGVGGLHNGYEAGNLPLLNSQVGGGGKAGQIRFAGFSAELCGYCLVLDGATGGNNAFAIIALLRAYAETKRPEFLTTAAKVGNWIYDQLLDTSGTGFGGYFVGYPDDGVIPKTLIRSKSAENNADIFAAFTSLATAYAHYPNQAKMWTARAKIAGDFVIQMFDSSRGCFNAGTVPPNTPPGYGTDPTGPVKGNDVTNVFNFLDSNSFTYLALSQSSQYGNAINWSQVPACLGQFAQTVQAAGRTFQGYDIVSAPGGGPNGVAWEFTGQAAVVIHLSGGNAAPIVSDLLAAQQYAPFGDGNGVVAATMQDGDTLPPYQQCIDTPYQCIPQRVGIAATAWGIFAEQGFNPLASN